MTTDVNKMEHKQAGYQTRGRQDPYDAHDSYNSSPTYGSSQQKPAFMVNMHNNGDKVNSGKPVLIQTKYLATFDKLLDQCSDTMVPPFGCGRRMHSARSGRRIHAVGDLKPGNHYVLTGVEPYKIYDYKEITGRPRPKFRTYKDHENRFEQVVPGKHAQKYNDLQGKAFAQNEQVRSLRIFVHIWGHEQDPPHKINVGFKQKNRLFSIKKVISDTLFVHEDSPMYKFKYGEQRIDEVTEPGDLKKDDVVLVVNGLHGRVLKETILQSITNYTPTGRKPLLVHNVTPRNVPYYNYEPFPAPQENRSRRNRLGKYRPLPSIGSSSKQSGPTISPYSNPPSQGGRKHHSNRGRQAREIDYDEDKGGVYRAKGQDNSRGAKQEKINEDTNEEGGNVDLKKDSGKAMEAENEESNEDQT